MAVYPIARHSDGHAVAIAVLSMQVDEVKNIMVNNIEKVLERGEKIELLVDKTDNLRDQVRNAHGIM